MEKLFGNTAIAFNYKSDKALRRAYFLFSMMKHFPRLSMLLAKAGNYALKWKLPFARLLIKATFYDQFCGGESREQCHPVIKRLSAYQVKTALDFGVEGVDAPKEWIRMGNEIIETIVYVSDKEAVPVVSLKLTAIASFDLLEKYSKDKFSLSSDEQLEMFLLKERLKQICAAADRANKSIYLDAEESWIQPALDDLALEMMIKFNREKPVLYNTYQLYIKNSLGRLKSHHESCIRRGSYFAAKLVRGAYIEKETKRATVLGIETPVQPSKSATDEAYDAAMDYCFNHNQDTFISLATHNEISSQKAMDAIEENCFPSDRIHFCQLYGMSDHITFNLASKGYYAMKYLPFGKIEETFPYMIRRAEENTSVTSDASNELTRIAEELNRRKVPTVRLKPQLSR